MLKTLKLNLIIPSLLVTMAALVTVMQPRLAFQATAQENTYLVSGFVRFAGTLNPVTGARVVLRDRDNGTQTQVTVDAEGQYQFQAVNGNYKVSPIRPRLTYTPKVHTVTVNGTDVTGLDFTATE